MFKCTLLSPEEVVHHTSLDYEYTSNARNETLLTNTHVGSTFFLFFKYSNLQTGYRALNMGIL